jgi:perosamine synthetase
LNIPILKIPFDNDDVAAIQNGIGEVFESGFLSGGKKNGEFERLFAEFSDATNAISCTNGTSAIELIIRGLGITGKKIILPTNTFMATALAVLNTGNTVVFADCEADSMCLAPTEVARLLSDDIGAVITVHIGGVISPSIVDIAELCEKNGIPLIEDCAHAHGCKFDGKTAGNFGVAGAYSFFPTKVLTTGEGGMVTTNDDKLAANIRMILNQGKNPDAGNHISEFGDNFRINELTAVVGIQQMLRAEEIVAARQAIAEKYDELVAKIDGVSSLKLDNAASSSYYKYIVFLDDDIDRTALKTRMKEQHSVSLTGEVYADLCHDEPIWDNFDFAGEAGSAKSTDNFPVSQKVAQTHACLPLYPGLTTEQIEYVAESLEESIRAQR